MSKNINTIADETAAAIESLRTDEAAQVEPAQLVNEVPSADLVIEALLEQFKTTETLTAYQIHVVANLAFEILNVRNSDDEIKQIAPQYVYNKTKSIRAAKVAQGADAARFELDEVRDVLNSIVGGTKTITSSKDRLNKDALRANALKALKG